MSGDKIDSYRLDKFLAECGVVSRRQAKEVILGGSVTVNDQIVYEPGYRVNVFSDFVKFNDEKITPVTKYRYILVNKPKGIITTCKDTHNRKTVIDLVGKMGARLYPIGRLDKDTSGLLLITNDGRFAYRATHPKFELLKTYEVTLDKEPTKEDLKTISSGVMVDGRKTFPAKIVKKVPKMGRETSSLFEIIIHEGRNRQIRKMFLTQKYRVKSLKRVKYGNISLGNMKESSHRELTPRERKGIFKILGMDYE